MNNVGAGITNITRSVLIERVFGARSLPTPATISVSRRIIGSRDRELCKLFLYYGSSIGHIIRLPCGNSFISSFIGG